LLEQIAATQIANKKPTQPQYFSLNCNSQVAK